MRNTRTVYRRAAVRDTSCTTVEVRKDANGMFHVRETFMYTGETYDRRDGRVNPPCRAVSVTSISVCDDECDAVREADEWYMANIGI